MNHFETEVDFCADGALQQYILNAEYNTHPCDAVRQAQVFAKHCAIYSADIPPAYEVPTVAFFVRAVCFTTNAVLTTSFMEYLNRNIR